MPKYTVIRLKNFKGGLHLARGLTNAYDKTLETLHSDTLKSAIFVCALQLYGSEEIDESFLDNFRISSAFPFYQSSTLNQTFYFFPKPETTELPFRMAGIDASEGKKFKKVRFIEKSLFQQILQGVTIPELESNNLVGSFVTNKDIDFKGILDQENCEDITNTEPYQHVNIPREYGLDGIPYYVDKIHFHENAGLYFLLDASDDAKSKVMAAMKLLADNGIGTDRNTGNGQFEYDKSEMALEVPENANYQLTLSLYCPEKEEIESDVQKSFYGLTKRGGYISSPENVDHQTIRKKSVYMFTEGSLFPYRENRKGKTVSLKPAFATLDHQIWRDGQPIFVPFNLKTDES